MTGEERRGEERRGEERRGEGKKGRDARRCAKRCWAGTPRPYT
jgi:hypothetical protein